jgi:TonB-linked SusC/RagA family outer membrane protein
MKIKMKLLHVLMLIAFVGSASAQQKQISGTVTDANGLPLPGVNILVEGTSTGTQTDFDGNYAIRAEEGETLLFTYIGQRPERRVVEGLNNINVQMQEDTQALDEVVVTAQGVRREKKALGYAVTELGSESVEQRPERDLGRVLGGKIAGVQVTGTGGAVGSGTNIIIRGQSSINQSNQPLFVVDGVPFDGGTNDQTNFVDGGAVTSSRFLDLDPNNIENITVLKGLSATVTYGQQGRNGVILITTKNGSAGSSRKKFEVTAVQSVTVNKVANLPDYQNRYGQGADQVANRGFVGNWGAAFSDLDVVEHPYFASNLAGSFPEYQGVFIPYEPVKDNVRDFFRDGMGQTTSINVSSGDGQTNYNLNMGLTEEDGFIPGNKLRRINLGIGGNTKLSNNFSFNGTANFSITNFDTPPIAAANGAGAVSIFQRTLFIPRNLDLNNLPYQDPVTGASVYYRTDQENPLWLVDNAGFGQDTRRFFGTVSSTYDINDKLSLNYRLGLDTYTENQAFHVNKGGVSAIQYQLGYLRTTSGVNTIWNHDFIFNMNDLKLSDKIGLTGQLGFNARRDTYEQTGVVSTEQIVFGFIDHNNYKTQSNRDPFNTNLDFRTEQNILGLYGSLNFNYDTYLYLTLSGRNDWGSTVESVNRSLFYPGASISFVPTSAFEGLQSDALNYLKFRASYGTSAGFPTPYNTRPTLVIATGAFTDKNGNPINTNSNNPQFPNPDLKPELQREIELGIESNLFNNRVSLEGSVYKRIAEDQILNRNLDDATGFTSTLINAGKIETKGLEIGLDVTPIQTNGFRWNINNNFTAYETTVVELPDEIDQIIYAGFANLGNVAIEGEPLGAILGSYALKDENGQYLINPSDGNIIDNDDVGQAPKIVGDPNPDWRLTSINSLSFRGLTLTAQMEYSHGGDFYSNTIGSLLRRGVTKDTEDRERTFIIPGVLADPNTGEILRDENGNTIQNNIQQGPNELYFLNFVDPDGQVVYDASWIRLREISLSYALPSRFLDKTPFGSLSFTLSGQNLWYNAPNVPRFTNFDPEILSTGVGNGQGLDFNTGPTSKRYGLSVKATF